MLKHILIVATGGALGAVLRYLNHIFIRSLFGTNVPWATLISNVIGCLLMGIAFTWFLDKYQASESIRLFIMVGFLGALTTWSTFSMETVLMINTGELIKGFTYLLATFILCFTAFFIGMKLTEAFAS